MLTSPGRRLGTCGEAGCGQRRRRSWTGWTPWGRDGCVACPWVCGNGTASVTRVVPGEGAATESADAVGGSAGGLGGLVMLNMFR